MLDITTEQLARFMHEEAGRCENRIGWQPWDKLHESSRDTYRHVARAVAKKLKRRLAKEVEVPCRT